MRKGTTRVDVTQDHVKLLQRMHLYWYDCEFGAPAVDCKRPYGNSSVYCDIAEILGIEMADSDEDFSREQKDRMRRLHSETEVLLAILIQDLKLELGTYVLLDRRWLREPGWLAEMYAFSEAGDVDRALDVWAEKTDDLFCAGKFDECDEVLRVVDVQRIDGDLAAGLLSFTMCARDKLPSLAALVGRVEERLRALRPAREVERLMSHFR